MKILMQIPLKFRINFILLMSLIQLLGQDSLHINNLHHSVAKPQVLLLNSYHKGFLWTDDITKGVEDIFNQKKVDLYVEYMDTKRQFNEEYLTLFHRLLEIKFKKHHYDLVITSDDNAFNYIKGRGRSLFSNVPLVFCGVNYLKKETLDTLYGVTGVNEKIDLLSNLNLIQQIHETCRKVVIITENTPTGVHIQKEINRIKEQSLTSLDIETLYDIAFDDLEKRLKNLTPETIVLHTIFSRDKIEQYIDIDEAAERICSASPVPVYGSWDFTLGYGIVGGYLVNGYQQGVDAAKMALEILDGKSPNEIPVKWHTPARPIFDDRQLSFRNISDTKLPAGSVILFRPKSFYKEYKLLFINISVVIALLMIAVLGLLSGYLRTKASKIQIQESEELFRKLAQTAPVGILLYQNNHWIFANEAAEKIFGYSLDELKANELFIMVAPDYREKVKERVMLRQQNLPAENEYELKIVTKEGVEKWVLLDGCTIKYNGAFAGLVSILDISKLKNSNDKLNNLQNFLSNIINSMPSAMASLNQEGQVLLWNEQFEKKTGIRAEVARGHKLTELIPDFKKYTSLIDESISEQKTIHRLKQTRMTEKGKVFEDITLFPIAVESSKGVTLRIDEVTEKIQMEEMMVQSEKMLSIGGLAAGMAHEINNPIAGMLQNAIVLENKLLKNSPKNLDIAREVGLDFEALGQFIEKRNIRKHLELIHDSGLKAADIVTNMLSFARKSESNFNYIRLPNLISKTLEILKNDYDLKKNYDFKKIKISQTYAEDLPEIKCEETKIQQVIMNILRNGAEAMGEYTIKNADPEIGIHAYRKGNLIHLIIENNGPPIPDSIRNRIFDPFFTTKEIGKGTGIGLSVSYFIITKNHNGNMWVKSGKNETTKFIIELPLNERNDSNETSNI